MILIFSRSEPICVSKEIILSTYVLNNLACWQDDECDYKHLWKKPWMTADSLDYHFKMSAKHLDWKEQLYQDGILGRRIFLLLVHRGLENIIELTGLKKTLCIQLYETPNTLIKDINIKSMKLCEATSQFSWRKDRSSTWAWVSLAVCWRAEVYTKKIMGYVLKWP